MSDEPLFSSDTFNAVTRESKESITAVFTEEAGKLYVHLEFRDKDGKLREKTEKKEWLFPVNPMDAYELDKLRCRTLNFDYISLGGREDDV